MNSSVVIKKSIKTPEKNGKYWRLICLNGPNKGTVYYLKGKRVLLGRGDKTDIPIKDKKTSREHAELVKIDEKYVISDLQSQNGVIINQEKINQKGLDTGDRIQLGRTIYRYEILDVKNPLSLLENMLDEKKDDEDDIEDVEDSEKGKKKKNLFIGLGLILLVLFMMEEDPSSKKEKVKKVPTINEEKFDNLRKKEDKLDKEIEENLVTLIQRGLREYREKNFFRAINEFNLALILSPNHSRASFYLRRTKQRLDEEIQLNFLRAKRERDSLKYKASAVSNCAILKLLEGYQEDDRYKEAISNIKQLEQLMGLNEGEIKCI